MAKAQSPSNRASAGTAERECVDDCYRYHPDRKTICSQGMDGFHCTRAEGHSGPHVACHSAKHNLTGVDLSGSGKRGRKLNVISCAECDKPPGSDQCSDRSREHSLFCCLPPGHKGNHSACGLTWDRDNESEITAAPPDDYPRGGETVANGMRTTYEKKNVGRMGEIDVKVERLYRMIREQSYSDEYQQLDDDGRERIQSLVDDDIAVIIDALDSIEDHLDSPNDYLD